MVSDEQIRVSKEFKEICNYIRARCIMYGKKVPSIADITKKIAEDVDKEKLYQDEFS